MFLITQTIQIKRATQARKNGWRRKDKVISAIPQKIRMHGFISVIRPPEIYISKLCVDIGLYLEDLRRAMVDRDEL